MEKMLGKHNFCILKIGKTGMTLGFLPGVGQNLWNLLFPLIWLVDYLLLKTPLSYFVHHMQIIAQKVCN